MTLSDLRKIIYDDYFILMDKYDPEIDYSVREWVENYVFVNTVFHPDNLTDEDIREIYELVKEYEKYNLVSDKRDKKLGI